MKQKSVVQIYVKLLVEMLFRRAVKKSNSTCTDAAIDTMTEELYKKIWADVEGCCLDITPERVEKLSRAIFRELCKMWHCSKKTVLALMMLQESLVDNSIAKAKVIHFWFSAC